MIDTDLASLTSEYPMGGLRVVETLPTIGRNVNVIMADEDGTRFVLRCHRRNSDPARIRFQLDFQEHLRERGIPAPEIIATGVGDRLVTDGRHTWVLFRYVAGQPYDYASERQLCNAARCLADLHTAAEDFAGAAVTDETIPDVRRWWRHGAEDLDELHRMFAGRGVDAELAFLDAWWSDLIARFPLEVVDALPPAWVHSDFHGGNLAYARDRVVGVFDFDCVHRGVRIEDVAYASFWFARANAGSNTMHWRRAALFQEHFELTGTERAVLPAFLIATQARNAARYRIREREGADPATALRHHIARMRQLAQAV